MDQSDLEALLVPLSDEEPCGPDLEYDAEFGEMERAAQSSAEQQFGDTIVAGEPADWKDVKKRAEALLTRTKDMRVVSYLARASLHQDGVVGFERALHILRGYLETFWDSVHPELDHEDNDDPTYRTNTLITFCDEQGMLRDLRDAPLVASRAIGKFSLRDVETATEAAENPVAATEAENGDEEGSAGPTLGVIDAAFSDNAIETIQETEQALRLSVEHIIAIEQYVTEQVGVTFAVSLAPARKLLEEMHKFVVAQLERRGVFPGQSEEEASGDDADDGWSAAGWGDSEEQPATATATESTTTATAAASQGHYVGGKIASRKDAIKALDDVCDYYESNEPSSPLPLLIRRAQRLASKSFLEILRDLAPDAVSQAEALGGGSSGSSDAGSSSWSDSSSSPSQTSETSEKDSSSTW